VRAITRRIVLGVGQNTKLDFSLKATDISQGDGMELQTARAVMKTTKGRLNKILFTLPLSLHAKYSPIAPSQYTPDLFI
jgi:hypothetical protein